MAKRIELQKNNIDLANILRQIKLNVSANINCHNIGRILEFDKDTQTCTVEILQIAQYNGKSFPLAPITQVPLVIYGAGAGHITLPNPVGTYCLLFFMDRNIDNFLLTGEQYEPETTRMHDFTDCIAITTFKTLANPLDNYDERAVSILNTEIIEDVSYSSYVKVYGNEIALNSDSINTSAETITSEATNITNTASNNLINESSLGGKITTGATVNISNTTYDLNLLIQAFLTACEEITISGTTLSPTSKDAFTALKAQFEGLLQ